MSLPSFKQYGRLGAPIMTARIPLERIPERLARYDEGLVEGGFDAATRERLRSQVAVWRHVFVGESQAEAEETLAGAVLHTRHHMLHARSTWNPADFRVDPAFLNPFNDPSVSDDDAVRWSLGSGAIVGTATHVAEQVAALHDAGVRHLLCQLSFGYLPHERIMTSMRTFATEVMPRFR